MRRDIPDLRSASNLGLDVVKARIYFFECALTKWLLAVESGFEDGVLGRLNVKQLISREYLQIECTEPSHNFSKHCNVA